MRLSAYIKEGELEFIDLGESFAKKTVLPMLGGDTADGNQERVPSILDKAFEIGLASSPDRSMPGYEYGVWGSSVRDSGLRLSALLLSAIAEVCGGIAMNLHCQGVASNVITSSGKSLTGIRKRVALAIQEGFGPPGYGTLIDPGSDSPQRISTQAYPTASGYVIRGNKSFVYSMQGTQAFVVLCGMVEERGDGWGCFIIPAEARGLMIQPILERTGLRACELQHLEFNDVEVQDSARLDEGNASDLVRHAMGMHWLGLSAISAGIGRGAAKSARDYASKRYQGCTMIENHPAVRKLIALSDVRVETAYALMLQTARLYPEDNDFLRQCAITKHMVTDLSFAAVTDSLQVFGGYGYMEDYGMEKRLRDVAVLKAAYGSRNYLELFIYEARVESQI